MAPSKMEQSKKNHQTAIKKINRICDWIRDHAHTVNPTQLEFQRDLLKKAYETFDEVHDEIEDLSSDPDTDAGDRSNIDKLFLERYSLATDILKNNTSSAQSITPPAIVTPIHKPKVKLPNIAVPIFSGDPVEFVHFIELFTALINNNTELTDIEKFMYLKGFLKGEPSRLVSNLQVTNDNFRVALDLLSHNYANENVIVRKLVNSIIDAKSIPNSSSSTPSALREFYVTVNTAIKALQNLKITKEKLCDILLVCILERKLDFGTKRSLEFENKNVTSLPNLDEFLEQIDIRCSHLRNLNGDFGEKPHHKSDSFKSGNKAVYHSVASTSRQTRFSPPRENFRPSSPTFKCLFCSESSHRIYSCNKFIQLSVPDRFNFIKKQSLCINCLGGRHSSGDCLSKRSCAMCGKKHHSLLHRTNETPSNTSTHVVNRSSSKSAARSRKNNSTGNARPSSSNEANSPSREEGPSVVGLCANPVHVLLGTIKVQFYSNNGRLVVARALMDSGSQLSFVTRDLIAKLDYPVYKKPVTISAINNMPHVVQEVADLVMNSVVSKDKLKISCSVLDNITAKLPQVQIDLTKLNIPSHCKLADDECGKPGTIDLLIGVGDAVRILQSEIIRLGPDRPVLQKSSFGYILSGNVPPYCAKKVSNKISACNKVSVSSHALVLQTNVVADVALDDFVKRFWELDEQEQPNSISQENKMTENIFDATTMRLPDGSYQVDLPFRTPNEASKLGDSFQIAKRRFVSLENKLIQNPSLMTDYSEVIDEYVKLEHAKEVPLSFKNEQGFNAHFLPHFAVVRDSESTKTRVVFDASVPTSSKASLNDVLFTGFQVQPNLYDILIRLRSFRFVLLVDIQKMYRQVHVNPQHTFLLNFLWRSNPQEDLRCFQHNRLVFGTRPAPYLATKVLNRLAEENRREFPLAYQALTSQTYVDDILSGCHNEGDLTKLNFELTQVLESANFTLHKYCSNSNKFLKQISASPMEAYELNFEESSNKILGLKWSPKEDQFFFSFPNMSVQGPITKRAILTVVAQCWDPLGFLSPIVLLGKLLVQRAWSLSIGWDQPVSDSQVLADWTRWLEEFSKISLIQIPRYLFCAKTNRKVELHVFCDASSAAYAAAAYLRAEYTDGSVSVRLATSKTRVAPLKDSMTIPRLELAAMLLGSELAVKLLSILAHSVTIADVHLWSDSEIALYWVKGPPTRWAVYVANRAQKIRSLTSAFYWHHVKSADNAADIASRGSSTSNLANTITWFQGPRFLSEPNIPYSLFRINFNIGDVPEGKPLVVALNTVTRPDWWDDLFKKCSVFSKIRRVVAWICRYVSNCAGKTSKQGHSPEGDTLTAAELRKAELLIVRRLQANSFDHIITALKQKKTNPDKQLRSLNLFWDDNDQFLKVGGRLQNANISKEQKAPILLPARNKIVSLMLFEEHVRLAHLGPQGTLSNFRVRYWPLNGIRTIKNVIFHCNRCFRFRATGTSQLMADLPEDRVKEARPFSKVSIDYGGHFLLKTSKLRKAALSKAYVAVFVCMVTKAIHIELVSSLSTEDFILALKRFISRRGNPTLIFSDNGTNFVGARNSLQELRQFFRDKTNSLDIQNFAAKNFISFKFIPPRSPHHGGLHESAIRSAKYHLRRLVGDTRYSFESFMTILTQIEAVLNSRPITPLSNDPSDLECLTPAHFLIGSAMTAFPEKDVTSISPNRLSLYQHISRMQQTFWKRWRTDYLNQLQHRPKWQLSKANIEVGDIVLLKDEDSTPLKWPLARVIETFPGEDGKVRTVKVKTTTGLFIRPIVKVCPLPFNDRELAEEEQIHQ